VSSKIMMMSMTRLFHNITQNLQDQDQDHSLQDQDRFFLVSDRSCPKTTVSDHITVISTAPKPHFFPLLSYWKITCGVVRNMRKPWLVRDAGIVVLQYMHFIGQQTCTRGARGVRIPQPRIRSDCRFWPKIRNRVHNV